MNYQFHGNPNGNLSASQGDQGFDVDVSPNNYFICNGGTVWIAFNVSGSESGAWGGVVSASGSGSWPAAMVAGYSRTVAYSEILRGALALAGIPVEDVTDTEWTQLRALADQRLQVAWEIHGWPEICRIEMRSFRAPYDAAHTYAAGDEVLDILTLTYLQALQASTGQPPTINGAPNTAYWAPCQTALSVASNWDSDRVYGVGDTVRDPVDGQTYQCIRKSDTITVSGAGRTAVNQVYQSAGTYNGRTYWTSTDVYATYSFAWKDGAWHLGIFTPGMGYFTPIYTGVGDTASPDLATPWYSEDGADDPPCVLTGARARPGLNPLTWGRLNPFRRTVAAQQTLADGTPLTPIGEVLAAYDRDPRATTKLTRLNTSLTNEGWTFSSVRNTPAYVWLKFRRQRPELTGDRWAASATYAAGDQMYFETAAGVGNFYTATAGTVAGESPATSPDKWTVVALPYFLRLYLMRGLYADWLASDGQTDKAAAAEAQANQALELEADKLQRQQGQAERLNFRS